MDLDEADLSADALSRLWRVRKTLAQMLNDRDYFVMEEEQTQSFDEFKEKFGATAGLRERMLMLHQKKDNAADQIFVFFPDEKKVSVKYIRGIEARMKEDKVKRAIIVAQVGLTPFSKQVLQAMEDDYLIEQFQEEELLVNITKHILVPEHKVLSDREKAALLEKYKLKETQLPRIQHSDPISRYYGMSRGQVVKIVRASETAGRYVTYRLVI